MEENGRILIPAAYRKELGFKPGEPLTLQADETGLHIQSRRQQIRQIQESMKKYIKPGRSMSDELIAERRREARHERNR